MNENTFEDQPIAWTPSPEVIERAQLTKFMRQVGVSTFDELYQYSIRDVEKFTEEVLKFLDIRFDPPYSKLLDTSNGPEFPNWLQAETRPVGSVPAMQKPAQSKGETHAGLNITEMCLDRWQTDEMKDQPAVIWEGEEGLVETLTYKELFDDVTKCAAGLSANGFGKGDAIGIHLPMIPETVIALLAINRIGAIAVPVFSGYGVEAIVSRMNAVGAKALFTSFGFSRRGKLVRSSGFEAAGKCPNLRTVFVTTPKAKLSQNPPPPNPRTREESLDEKARQMRETYRAMSRDEKLEYRRRMVEETKRQKEEFYTSLSFSEEQIAKFERDEVQQGQARISFGIYDLKTEPIEHPSQVETWDSLMDSEPQSETEQTSAEDPLIILYTSGTTGKPKGIAHTHASFPIKAAQDMAFGTDVGRGTRICWYTDIGWMMGPWLIYGALINGATICLYDGAPDYPTPDRMWEFCAKH